MVAQTDEEALDLLDGVIARDPTNLHAHYCRGVLLERLGLWGRAHAEFQTVIDKDPNDAHAWYMLGSTVRVPEPDDSVRRGDLESCARNRTIKPLCFARSRAGIGRCNATHT